MKNRDVARCVIFGGTGFIGSHFAKVLLDANICTDVILADIAPVDINRFDFLLSDYIAAGKVEYCSCDVRSFQSFSNLSRDNVGLIVNLAAVHREPGHEPVEYYETNIAGAENVCRWAAEVGCQNIVFTSSIAPYGPAGEFKTEASIPSPETAYGGSKLVAEKIHLAWHGTDLANRRLVIVRPGVVFGAGEGGNVTRLIKAVLGRYFFYMGNRNTEKAGIYIKELCATFLWALETVEKHERGWFLYNATMVPTPSVQKYVDAICRVSGIRRSIPNIPYGVLYSIAHLMEFLARPFGIKHPFSPVRIRKLVRSNNIKAEVLQEMGYDWKYNLESALTDWKKDCPSDFKN